MDVDKKRKKLKPWVADVEIRKEEPVKFFHSHYPGNENIPLPTGAFTRAKNVLEIDALADLGFNILEEYTKRNGKSKVRAATVAVQGNKVGVALCSVSDQFYREKGRRVAYSRMKNGQFTIDDDGKISQHFSKL